MNRYYIDRDYIHFKFDYNENLVRILKSLRAEYNHEIKKWYLPNTIKTSGKVLKVIKDFDFKLIEKSSLPEYQFDKTIKSKTVVKKSNHSLNDIKDLIDWFDFKLTPRPYQLDGIKYMLDYKKVINGSEMGLGKTGQSICAVEIEDLFPCLIICPSNVKYNFQKEWSKWTKDLPEIKIIESGKNQEFSKTGVSIINYEMLYERGDKNDPHYDPQQVIIKFNELYKTQWKSIIVDESHKTRNNKAKASKIIRKISKKSEYVFLLTGTPILKKPEQILNQLMILGIFKTVFITWNTFIQRFCDGIKAERGWVKNGFSNLGELNSTLKANCYFRVEKKDVLKDLPDVITSVVYLPLSNESQYKKAEIKILEHLLESKGEDAVLSAQEAVHLIKRMELQQLSHKGKIKALIEWIEDYLEATDENIVVFGNFKYGLEKISKKFNAQLIDGSVSAKKKQEMIDLVVNNEDRIVVGNTQSMGTGTDGLQHKFSTVVILDLANDPGTEDQTISRLDRSGQKRKVSVYKFVAEETVDMERLQLMTMERKIADTTNKGYISSMEVKIFDNIKNSITQRLNK